MTSARFANTIIAAVAAFLGLLLIFSVVTGRPAEYTIAIRVILIAGLVLMAVGWKLPAKSKVNLSVALVATGVSLLAAEMILQATEEGPYTDKYKSAAKSQGVNWDDRTRFEVVQDLRAEGVNANLALTPVLFDEAGPEGRDSLYAFGEISNTTIVMCNELGEWSIYESDEHGFNNPKGIWNRPKIDIVSIGDSFVHGQCVTPEENATTLIRKVYKDTLNLGTTATGTLVQLAVIKEYTKSVKPKAVLWFLFEGNDLPELLDEYNNNERAIQYLGSGYSQDLMSRQTEIDQQKKQTADQLLDERTGGNATFNYIRGRVTLNSLRRSISSGLRRNSKEPTGLVRNRQGGLCPSEEIIPLLTEVLEDGRDSVGSWGGKIFLVYLPTWTRYADPEAACVDDNGDMYLHDQTLKAAEDAGISVIDATPAFDAHPDPLSLYPFRLNGHYNASGYRLLADTILDSAELNEHLAND